MYSTELDVKTSNDELAQPSLYDLLTALGFRPTELVSINTRTVAGEFRSKLFRVAQLEDWSPPQDRDVWFGVNPLNENVLRRRRGRGRELDITRVRALFADLDIKSGSLGSMVECSEVVMNVGGTINTPPVAWVNSGHGLQPYWRLMSPSRKSNRINTANGYTREQWRGIYARWGGLFQREATNAVPGAQVDNVYELSRVMRCPGSVNWKDSANPVPVVTHVVAEPIGIRPDRLVRALRDVEPLGPLRPIAAKTPTSWPDAVAWINAQPGADCDLAELRRLGPARSMLDQVDPRAIGRQFAEATDTAHEVMLRKVYHVVLKSTEDFAGLALALKCVEAAYLEVMRLRSGGRLSGEARPPQIAVGEFRRAVVGAVAVARGRHRPVAPMRDASGEIVLPLRRQSGKRAS